jgi:hypothetical protein
MADSPVRLDGWKAIAAHFRRNRSTVIRWAEAGDFPVRRVGGKAGASVWAYAHELDAWLAAGGGAPGEGASGDAPTDTLPDGPASAAVGSREAPTEPATAPLVATWPRFGLPTWTIGAACLILLVMGGAVGAALWFRPPAASARAQFLPADPAVADLYLRARDDWARRTPESLRRSIDEFGAVGAHDPGYAPAYAGLADAYFETSMFDLQPASAWVPKAEAALKIALALDPDNVEANRTLGGLDYYVRRDLAAARRHLGLSLRIAPNDSLTHFQLGVILRDSGD